MGLSGESGFALRVEEGFVVFPLLLLALLIELDPTADVTVVGQRRSS
jgi:hypothetical protein